MCLQSLCLILSLALVVPAAAQRPEPRVSLSVLLERTR
jgi:hypothetical protein